MKYAESVLAYKAKYKEIKDLVENTDKVFLEKYFTEGKSNKTFTPPFIPGQIYSFSYLTDSKVTEKRPFVNRNPIIICTGTFKKKNETILKGIDLITVPPSDKIKILSVIFDGYTNIIEKNEDSYLKGGNITPIDLSDFMLERSLYNTGYKKSIFGFKTRFIRDPKILDLEDWFKIPYLKHSIIEGMNLQGIYNEYESKTI